MSVFIPRAMQSTLHDVLKIFPSATICGPRQSGKTTLCRKEFPDLPYVNLEDLSIRQFAIEDPKGFLSQFSQGVIIDEVQQVPDILSQIQVIIDEDRFKGIENRKFLLTGSSNFAMLPQVRQSLAGRTAFLTLLPLSTQEIINGGFIDFTTNSEIIKGGYPTVWTKPEDNSRIILENYINAYVERDVRNLLNIEDYSKFTTFIRLCASRIGYELNKSSLAIETGVSVPTIDRWISVLEATYVVYLLKPWYGNISKRLVKAPKLYFYDTGIATTLLGVNSVEQLIGHPLRGSLFENLVINNVIKYGYNKGLSENLFFYRDKSGHEVDLVWEQPNGLYAIEIKASMTYNTDFRKNLDYLKMLLNDKIIESKIIYNGDSELKGEIGVSNYKNFPSL